MSKPQSELFNEILEAARALPEDQRKAYAREACGDDGDLLNSILAALRVFREQPNSPPSLFELIYDEAQELPTRLRNAFLKQVCGDDEKLYRELDEMLSLGDMTADGGLFDEKPQLTPEDVVAFEQRYNMDMVGRRIGDFKIVDKIAEGGMGAVYRAERVAGGFEQTVALKIVRPGMYSEGGIDRFEDERRILAQLEHANIARLIDGGETEEGLPYFVMEYVEGQPLDTYCNDHQLTIRQRLELFISVCEAVRYAHSNLVVHRDLKPSNILVKEEDGVVKLLDFGIAKIRQPNEEETIFLTGQNLQPLTIAYAAPEQVKGRNVSAATDVYALGVNLYELLTGHRPFSLEGKSFQDISAKICDVVPPLPSTVVTRAYESSGRVMTAEVLGKERSSEPQKLKNQLAGDLDAIVMKALKKEPGGRYRTAGELVADIEAYLNRRPVLARKDTKRYRAQKFIQRNKVPVAAFTLFALAIITGLIISLIQADIIREERDLTQRQAERTEDVLDYFLEFITPMVNPDLIGQQNVTVAEMLPKGVEGTQKLEDDPLTRARVISAFASLEFNRAAYAVGDSLAMVAIELAKSAGPEGRIELARGLYLSGIGKYNMLQFDTAISSLNEARVILDEEAHLTSRMGVEVLSYLSEALNQNGEHEPAIRWGKGAVDYAERLTDVDEDLRRRLIATANTFIADGLSRLGNYAEADSLLRFALKEQQELLGIDHPKTVHTEYRFANNLVTLELYEEAEPIYESNLFKYRNTYQDENHHSVISAKIALASVKARTNSGLAEALSINREADESLVNGGQLLEWRVMTFRNYGLIYRNLGNLQLSEEYLRDGIELYELHKSQGGGLPEIYLAPLLCFLGETLEARQDYEEAAHWYQLCLDMIESNKLLSMKHVADKVTESLQSISIGSQESEDATNVRVNLE